MGNCQAIDSATLVIQHPSGRADNLYWPVTAAEVMKSNPGHCVALLLATTTTTFRPPITPTTTGRGATKSDDDVKKSSDTVRVTRIKILRPTDMLVLGQVYRLVTNQEVIKGRSAKKYAEMKKNQETCNSLSTPAQKKSVTESNKQVQKEEKHRTNSAVMGKSRPWRPSLISISESTT